MTHLQPITELPIVTSDTNPIHVDFLSEHVVGLPGRIGLTYAPGKRNLGQHAIWERNLDQDLARLRQHYKAEWLITLLQAPELTHLHIPNLFPKTQDYEMQSRWFPIQDYHVPTSMQGLMELVHSILMLAEQGHTQIIHCRAGLGRTGLVASACLAARGYSAKEAFGHVRSARPGCVETAAQEAYVHEFAKVWRSRH